MAVNKVFVEFREENQDYAIRKPGSSRASGIGATQSEAAEEARKMFPDATIMLERVRNTKNGGRDKWRRFNG